MSLLCDKYIDHFKVGKLAVVCYDMLFFPKLLSHMMPANIIFPVVCSKAWVLSHGTGTLRTEIITFIVSEVTSVFWINWFPFIRAGMSHKP